MKGLSGRRQRGFSLLEMLVAITILAMSLGVLYQAAAGATRNVRVDERYTYALELARSLLADHAVLAPGGVDTNGDVEDFRWQVTSAAIARDDALPDALQFNLHRIEATVSWGSDQRREVRLVSIVPMIENADVPL